MIQAWHDLTSYASAFLNCIAKAVVRPQSPTAMVLEVADVCRCKER